MAILAELIVGAPVVYEFIVHSYVYKVPSAILASSLMVISLLTFCVGLILDNMVRLHKFDYQLKLLRSRRS